MAGITRKVHLVTGFEWGPIDKFAPDLGLRQEADDGGGTPVEPPALCFRDPDGETHVYVFSDDGRKKLIAALTGGIMVVPGGKR